VSRRHLEVEVGEDGTVAIRDAGSTNGTFLWAGGEVVRLVAGEEHALKPGEAVFLGGIREEQGFRGILPIYVEKVGGQVAELAKDKMEALQSMTEREALIPVGPPSEARPSREAAEGTESPAGREGGAPEGSKGLVARILGALGFANIPALGLGSRDRGAEPREGRREEERKDRKRGVPASH